MSEQRVGMLEVPSCVASPSGPLTLKRRFMDYGFDLLYIPHGDMLHGTLKLS